MRQARCGTDSGYHRHRRSGEDPCGPCNTAHADANRVTNAARQAALTELSALFPDMYQRLYIKQMRARTAKAIR